MTSPSPDHARRVSPALPRTITVGDVRVSYVPDGFVELHPAAWYQNPALTDVPGTAASGFLVASVGALVVEEPDGVVVLEAGLGPLDIPANQTHPSLGRMAGGQAPADLGLGGSPVKAVAVTHAHEDHVGWLRTAAGAGSLLRGADVIVGAPDAPRLAHLTGLSGLRTVASPQRITGSITAIPTAGHTAGHTAYVIESHGQRAVCFGDVFHSPWQMSDVRVGAWSDEGPDEAVRSRELVLDLLSEPGAIGIGYHFSDVVFGRWDGDEWGPVEDLAREPAT